MDHETHPTTVRFPRKGWIAAVALGLALVALLGVNVLEIDRQRELAEVQENRAEDIARLAGPLLRDGGPLVEDLRQDAPRLRRASRNAAGLVRDTRPLVGDLARVNAPEALAAVGTLAIELLRGDRLVALVDRADRVLARLDPDRLLAEIEEAQRIAREGVEMQRQALAVQRETLAVQREALVHIRSLDRKTGGAPPGITPTPAPAPVPPTR